MSQNWFKIMSALVEMLENITSLLDRTKVCTQIVCVSLLVSPNQVI